MCKDSKVLYLHEIGAESVLTYNEPSSSSNYIIYICILYCGNCRWEACERGWEVCGMWGWCGDVLFWRRGVIILSSAGFDIKITLNYYAKKRPI